MNARALPRPALLAAVFLLNLTEFLQSGMVLFAAGPTMGRIGASPEEYTLIAALYAGVAVLSISQMTVLIQRLGWRDYLLASVLMFLAGAWCCAGSTTLAGFASGRILMAAGGGAFMTTARMLINLIPPSPQRVTGIAAFGSGLATGLAGAPWLAGTLVGAEAWSGMFLVLAVPATLAGALAWRFMPADAATLDGSPSDFHILDGMALGAAAFLLLHGLQRLGYDWHGERLRALGGLLAGLAAAAWFLLSQARRAHPFLKMDMLRSGRFLTGLGVFTVCYAVLGAFNVLLPQLLQKTLGVAFEAAGAVQGAGLSAALPAFVLMLLVVRRAPHATKFYVSAFLLLAAFGWHFARLDPSVPVWSGVAPWVGLFGAFVVPGMATTALHAFKDLQHDNVLFAHAQQLKNMLGQVGLALGAGVTAVLLQGRTALHGTRLAEVASAPAAVHAQQAGLLGSIDLFWGIAAIGLGGAFVLALQRRFD
jgi:MFS family permease